MQMVNFLFKTKTSLKEQKSSIYHLYNRLQISSIQDIFLKGFGDRVLINYSFCCRWDPYLD